MRWGEGVKGGQSGKGGKRGEGSKAFCRKEGEQEERGRQVRMWGRALAGQSAASQIKGAAERRRGAISRGGQ